MVITGNYFMVNLLKYCKCCQTGIARLLPEAVCNATTQRSLMPLLTSILKKKVL
jgi:hypothetical protein